MIEKRVNICLKVKLNSKIEKMYQSEVDKTKLVFPEEKFIKSFLTEAEKSQCNKTFVKEEIKKDIILNLFAEKFNDKLKEEEAKIIPKNDNSDDRKRDKGTLIYKED